MKKKMKIQHRENEGNGVFYIIQDKKQIATIEYVMHGTATMVINHTIVAKEFEGKGIGKKMVDAAVDFAREKEFKVKPLCPFASAIMHRTDNYNDVLINKIER